MNQGLRPDVTRGDGGRVPSPEDKRSIWADEEVIIIKPLEVYCPVINLISKLAVRG